MVHINKEVKNCRNYKASGNFPYHFVSLKRKQSFSLVPRFYGLSLLRTLNLPPRVSAITGVDCNKEMSWFDPFAFHTQVGRLYHRATENLRRDFVFAQHSLQALFAIMWEIIS